MAKALKRLTLRIMVWTKERQAFKREDENRINRQENIRIARKITKLKANSDQIDYFRNAVHRTK